MGLMYWIKHFGEFILFAWGLMLSVIIIVGLPALIIFAVLKVLENN